MPGGERDDGPRRVDRGTDARLHPGRAAGAHATNDPARAIEGEDVSHEIDVADGRGALPSAEQVRRVRLEGYDPAVPRDRGMAARSVCRSARCTPADELGRPPPQIAQEDIA